MTPSLLQLQLHLSPPFSEKFGVRVAPIQVPFLCQGHQRGLQATRFNGHLNVSHYLTQTLSSISMLFSVSTILSFCLSMTGGCRKTGEPSVSVDEMLVSPWLNLCLSVCLFLSSLSLHLRFFPYFLGNLDLSSPMVMAYADGSRTEPELHTPMSSCPVDISRWKSTGNSTLTCSKCALDFHPPSLVPASSFSLQ